MRGFIYFHMKSFLPLFLTFSNFFLLFLNSSYETLICILLRLPLCSTSSDAGALPSEVRIENDSDRKFSKSIFFQKFSGNHFYPRFMVRCSLLAENIFSVFRSPHSAPTHRYTILDSRLLPCNAISEGRLPLCNTSSEAGALPSDKQYMIDLL